MAERAPSIAIVAGEASGDLHGAHLASRLKDALPSARVFGIGGRKMREAGVDLLYDSSTWGAIGIAEALKLVPSLLAVLRKVKRSLDADPPDLVVLIDFGAFNARLGRHLHTSGVKVLYFFPPGSWNRRSNGDRLKDVADRIVTAFPWSADLLREHGLQADFFGHPLLDIVKPRMSRDEFCEHGGIEAGKPIIGLLPGSRAQEITHNLPAMTLAAARLLADSPDLQFAIPTAPSVNPFRLADELARLPWVDVEAHGTTDSAGASQFSLASEFERLMREDGFKAPASRLRIKLLPAMTYDVLAHSRASMVSSGTATVEAAILGSPMVIVYRGSRLTTLEYKLRGKKIRFIGMPNIILEKAACPELVANDATPGLIADLMSELIADTPRRAEMIADLRQVRTTLGEPGALDKTAQVVLEMIGRH